MVKFDLIRHGESCSNVYFTQDVATGNFTAGPHKDPNPGNLATGTICVPGDHFFATVLTPYGVAQCVTERRRLEDPATAYPAHEVRAVLSSPLERAVETAILTTPFAALRNCGWTVTLVPQLQEAVKYQCDVFSCRGLLETHVERTRKLYVAILTAEGRGADAAALAAVRIGLDWTAMDVEAAPPGVSRTRELVNESAARLEARAAEARGFLAALPTAGRDDARYLVFTHGQITEYLLDLPLCSPPKARLMEFVLEGLAHVPRVLEAPSLRLGLSAGDAREDTEERIEEGREAYRVLEKVAWIRKMGRVPGGVPPVCLGHPVPGKGQWPVGDSGRFRTTSLPKNEGLLKKLAAAAVEASQSYDPAKHMKSLWGQGEYPEMMLQRTVGAVAKK
ncbi:hypothetical protein PpBr36_03870 [Pyricularia pennisetigena]|uniref:hypothetical protein n=1 Tax=Pyricularia pennisetigena TaxID=1578925 RepID=UPI001151E1BD|nr:hypothetical protein PpBr36_03870 [Pyricularia pennisetigena]TLS31025.1 hypothetical protein PpBr36_03870 [Pyricularia pennisetigena]